MSPKTFECPNCGADVVVGKSVCRECGSDGRTGWQSSEEIDYQSIDIPDGYGPVDEGSSATPNRWLIPVIAILLALGMLLLSLAGWF